MSVRGRDCPLAYRYEPEALSEPPALEAATLYVAGGLYGNPGALEAVLDRAQTCRLSSDPEPPADSLYGATVGGVRCDALPVRFNGSRWLERFLSQWPPGTPGHAAHVARVAAGTPLRPEQAARDGVTLPA